MWRVRLLGNRFGVSLSHDLVRMANIRLAPCYSASSLRDISIGWHLFIAINHGHAIMAGQITQERIFQILLTVVTDA